MALIYRLSSLKNGTGLKQVAIRGTFWTTLGFGLQAVLRLGSSLVLTRLLVPEVFGLMSLAAVFIAAINLLSDLGTTPSVIRSKRGEETTFLETAWSVQAIRGAIITVVVCVIAWPVSLAYREPVLFPLLCALSVTAFMEGLASISIATAQRRMVLSRLTALNVAVQAVTTAANIYLAWELRSVWALVGGSIIGAAIRVWISYRWLPTFRPRLTFDKEALAEIVTFGRWILFGTLLTYLGGRGIQALMGGLVSIKTLGFISIASTLAWVFGDLTRKILGTVAFPAISRIYRERPEDFSQAVRRVKKAILLAVLPAFVLLSLLSQPLVDLLYDERYAVAGQFLSLLALNGSIGVASMPYQNALLSIGNSRAHAMVMASSATFRIAGLFIGFHLAGIPGMLAGIGIGTLLVYIVSTSFALRHGFASIRFDVLTIAPVLGLYAYTLATYQGG